MKKRLAVLLLLLLISAVSAACAKAEPQEKPAADTKPVAVTEELAEAQTETPFELVLDGISYSRDAAEIRVSSMPAEALEKLSQMSALKLVIAVEGDGENLEQLRQYCDAKGIAFRIEVAGQTVTDEATELTLPNVTEAQLRLLMLMPNLKILYFPEPEAPAELLVQLQQTASVTWEKTVLGMTFPWDAAEIDLTPVIALEAGQVMGDKTAYDYGCEEPIMSYPEEFPSSVLVTNEHPLPDKTDLTAQLIAEAEAAMPYFPNAEKLIMAGAWLDNEAMAQFRENHREDYKAVWSVQCGMLATRTDAPRFMPTKFFVTQGSFADWHTYNLRYCEDMVAIDIGHMSIAELDFVRYMPKLEYLDVAMNHLVDLEPLASCKNLKFLVMFDQLMELDYTPLKECTALVDLNISKGHGDISPILEMTWLENLWMVGHPEESYQRARAALPETQIGYYYSHPDGDWRKLPNYFKMRDALLMFYMD